VGGPHWGRGFYGWHGTAWVWFPGAYWVDSAYPGWLWIAPHWEWDGQEWVWETGYWTRYE